MVTYLNCMALALGISAGLSSAPRLGTPFTNTKSLSFDGTDDKVTPAVQLGSSFAISIWIKQNDQNTRYILDARDASNTSAISVQSQSEGSGIKLVSNAFNASAEVSINAWHHVAITYDSSSTTGKLYVDGALDNTKSISLGSSAAALTVGTRYSNQSFWSGGLDELATWNTVLDADAVSAIYNSGEPTDLTKNIGNYSASSNLQAYYRMGDATVPGADGTSNFIFDQADTTLGSELVTNGDFSADSDWSKSNSTIANGILTITVTGGAYGYAHQNVSYTSGRSYRLTAQVTGTADRQMRFLDNGSNSGGLTTSNGVITMTGALQNVELFWTANSNSNLVAVDRHTAHAVDYSFTVDNVSVHEVNGNTGTISGATIQTDTP